MTLLACSVCGAGQEGTDWAYLTMTGVVSLSPLVMIAAIVWWLYRTAKARELETPPRRSQLSLGEHSSSDVVSVPERIANHIPNHKV